MSDHDKTTEDGYEPPRADDLPAEDGPAVTAAGVTGAAEWRPSEEA